jgi:hypothetical protein
MQNTSENWVVRLSTLGVRFMLAAEYPPTRFMVVTAVVVAGSLEAKSL